MPRHCYRCGHADHVAIVVALGAVDDRALCCTCAESPTVVCAFLADVQAARGRAGATALHIGPALAVASAWLKFAHGLDSAATTPSPPVPPWG